LKSEVDELFNQCYLKEKVPQLQHEFRKSFDNLTALIDSKCQNLSQDISVINTGLEQYCNKSNLDQIITNLVNKFTSSFVPQKDYR
jgi:ABC-type phosphate transport system auxiliary subunit